MQSEKRHAPAPECGHGVRGVAAFENETLPIKTAEPLRLNLNGHGMFLSLMNDRTFDDRGEQVDLIVDQNQVRVVAYAQQPFLRFADNPRGHECAHLQWRRESETPIDVIPDHG